MTPSDQGDVDLDVDFAADRGNWTGKLDFLLSCIGYCVGLGNVWRFPYRAYTNGGGAFLVPYFLMLAICGIPLFFLELSLGQFSSLGPLAVWKISPLFKGAGAAMLLIVGLVAIYYNMIIAYVLFYLFASLTSNLPWEHCGNWWNTELCLEHRGPKSGNGVLPLNLSSTVSPSEEYWSRYVLHIQGSQGIGRPGEIRWNLCLCLLLAWVIVFLCILKGVKSSGKVVYFTATFPYLILLMLLVRGVTLPGAWKGIQFYLTPQFHHLLSSKAMTMLPLSPFWSFLFFFMLLTLGLDSQFAFLETIVTAVTDEFPYYLRPKKAVFSGLICVAMYLMGLILTTDGGMYWLVLLDDYSASFGLMVVVITTCLAVTRVYGIQRFCRDIHMMLGFKPGLYFRACWLFLSPATLLALLVYSIVKYQPSEYGSYRFPAWAELLGILMGLLSCLMIPAGMLVAVLREEGSLWERLQQASRPAMDWGPSLEENRTGMYVATLAGSQSPKPLMVRRSALKAESTPAARPRPRPCSHMASGVGAACEELPPDGTCDECEPDEAPGAEEVCRDCGFCYCRRHADAHRQKFLSHRLAAYVHGAQAWTPPASGGDDALPEDGEAKGEAEGEVESEVGEEESETEVDSESEEESETEEDSEDESDEESEEDSEEEMEDEQESEAEEDNQEGESEAEGETEAESEFDPEIEMEAERVAKRKCPDHGLDLSTYCQEDRQLICVLCPVIGAHRGHQLSTLDEAFEELRSKDSGGLKAAMIELVERLKFKSSDPKVTRDQMKIFIQQEFKKVQKVIADEEQKALHLVDIQEAMATAHVTEILADIQSHMDRLMTQMAQAKEQLDTSNESAEPKAEGDEEGPSGASEEEDT